MQNFLFPDLFALLPPDGDFQFSPPSLPLLPSLKSSQNFLSRAVKTLLHSLYRLGTVIRYRIDRMQYSRYFHVFRFYSIIHINVAMIIFHTKPEHPCIPACIAFCKPFIFQKTLCTVACMFDLKPGIFFNFIDTESSVTRTDQPLWLPNDSSCSRKCFSFKKFIERAVLFLLILIHRNLVLPDKPRN